MLYCCIARVRFFADQSKERRCMVNRLLELQDVSTHFFTSDGVVRAVDGVSFSISKGEVLAVVGESGCGKSVTSLSVMRLIPWPPGKVVSGRIMYTDAEENEKDLLQISEKDMQKIRGNDISMIFQEPMTSLNPVYTVGFQIAETIQVHQNVNAREAKARALEMLRIVGIPLPERRVNDYPHQLSGGMRQRVMIAMALACNPRLLIADEPTTALDVTVQAQILDLLRQLKAELDMAILLITHDLGVVAEMAQRVIVMYAGRLVEEANVYALFATPLHPYTEGLLRSIPRMEKAAKKLNVIQGVVPNPAFLPPGCRFAPRCPLADTRCHQEEPMLRSVGDRRIACWQR